MARAAVEKQACAVKVGMLYLRLVDSPSRQTAASQWNGSETEATRGQMEAIGLTGCGKSTFYSHASAGAGPVGEAVALANRASVPLLDQASRRRPLGEWPNCLIRSALLATTNHTFVPRLEMLEGW